MSVNDARKRANAKWDKENMTTLGCRVTKTKAAQFKQACQQLGTVPNAVLLQAVEQTIERAEREGE